MKPKLKLFAAGLLLARIGGVLAATRYVDQNSTNATPPYTTWSTAATNIQDAVDAAVAGDEIVVTNGIYANGGRAVYGTLTNRVTVDKPVSVRSINGPLFTMIRGRQVPGTTNGDGAIRCVYLTNGARLAGFTLTNGATHAVDDYPTNRESSGGGFWCESTDGIVVSNCAVTGNAAYVHGGGVYGGTVNNCTFNGNTALHGDGGGAYNGTLNNCTLSGNSAPEGGGAFGGTLSNCTLSGNSASFNGGGGASYGTLNNCTLSGNSANGTYGSSGGGAAGCTLNNCTLTGNSAYQYGGGADYSTLNNCTLSSNSVVFRYYAQGGGAYNSTLNNSLLTSNSSAGDGGGAYYCTLNNCTLIGNSAAYNGGGGNQVTLNNCTLRGNRAAYGLGFVGFGGGGAYQATLHNCALSGNSADYGGGTILGTLNNCTLTGNAAVYEGGGVYLSTLTNCIFFGNYHDGTGICEDCQSPGWQSGSNWIGDPLLMDTNGWANLRLQSNSPCINAGNNAYVVGSTDLDGNPRIKGGTVDIGAYEFQSPVSAISYAWLQYYGLPINSSADTADPDGDGMNNYQEWRCGTDPTNPLSALRMLAPAPTGTNVTVTWQSVPGINYFLERSANLTISPSFTRLATNIRGQPGLTTYTDTEAVGAGPFFYRVGVGN
jgi:hypothetical protein